jgi:hypothetical protein
MYILGDVFYILDDVLYILDDVLYILDDVLYILDDVFYIVNDVFYIIDDVFYILDDVFYILDDVFYVDFQSQKDTIYFLSFRRNLLRRFVRQSSTKDSYGMTTRYKSFLRNDKIGTFNY